MTPAWQAETRPAGGVFQVSVHVGEGQARDAVAEQVPGKPGPRSPPPRPARQPPL